MSNQQIPIDTIMAIPVERVWDGLRPVGLTNEQVSLLMSLNRPKPPRVGDVAPWRWTGRLSPQISSHSSDVGSPT